MRIVFMGTPEFAVPSLDMLNKENEILAVYTKVDKPNMRGNKVKYSPVKEYAISNDLKVIQPDSFRNENVVNDLIDMKPDLIVVVAYGKILPKSVIDIPKYGIINVHSSLLPKYRGAAPINAAIINGDKKTGVSIMYIAEKLDAGDVIVKEEVDILEEDNFLTLHDKLKVIGVSALTKAIDLIKNENVVREKQDEDEVTFVKPFKKEDLKIDWNSTKREIFNFVRGMNPFPGAYTIFNDEILKIYEVKEHDKVYENSINGEIVDVEKKLGYVVKVSDGSVIITKAKPQNKKTISGLDLVNGNFLKKGDRA